MTREEYYSNLEKSKELYHHGVKGQKWGVENGPPYPLDAEEKASIRKQKKENKKAKKIVKKINNIQQQYDTYTIIKKHNKEHPIATKVGGGIVAGVAGIVTAGYATVGTLIGGPAVGIASATGVAGAFGGLMISQISYNKSIPKKVDKYLEELNQKGYTVDMIPTTYTYMESYNGGPAYDYGTINTKRYRLNTDSK